MSLSKLAFPALKQPRTYLSQPNLSLSLQMEATLALQHRSPVSTRVHWRHMRLEKHSPKILYKLTRPTDDAGKVTRLKSIYKDNWFDLIAINHISQSVQTTTGFRNKKSGYESFVEAATEAWHNFNPIQQHEIIIKALKKAFPGPILAMIRTLLPNSKFTREYFAVFTTVFFTWLVGPNEVRESELNGQRERNVVHVNKCRFLEESNCVGMCINLCKLPSQTFIKDSLGVPVNMVPNFDDMSCEMIFGQDPPATSEDPAFKQPCYKLCKANKRHSTICSSQV